MSVDLNIRGTVDVLHVEPGDKLLVTFDGRPPTEQARDAMKARLEEIFPGCPVLFVSSDVRLGIVRAA